MSGEQAIKVPEGMCFPRMVCGEVRRRTLRRLVYNLPVSRKVASRRSRDLASRRAARRGVRSAWRRDQQNVVVWLVCAPITKPRIWYPYTKQVKLSSFKQRVMNKLGGQGTIDIFASFSIEDKL